MRIGRAILSHVTVGLAAIGLAGCGTDAETRGADIRSPKPIVSTCHVPGLGPVRGEVPLSCEAIEWNYERVRDLLDAHGILAKGRSTEHELETRTLVIDDQYVLRGDSIQYNGYYLSTAGVTLAGTRSGTSALLHELLHLLQIRWGIRNTGAHPGWTENGYFVTDGEYRSLALSILLDE